MTKYNVRCCCEPGLVLGSVELSDTLPTGVVLKGEDGAELALTVEVFSCTVVDFLTGDTVTTAGRAVNSNHATLAELLQFPAFRPICLLEDAHSNTRRKPAPPLEAALRR